MSTVRVMCIAASALLTITFTGCSESGESSTSSRGALSSPPPKSPAVSSSSDGPSGQVAPPGATDSKPSETNLHDNAGPCALLIGKWKATFDKGAEASGDAIPLGQTISISGDMNFTLTHDDADLPNVVDFVGSTTVTALGQTTTYSL